MNTKSNNVKENFGLNKPKNNDNLFFSNDSPTKDNYYDKSTNLNFQNKQNSTTPTYANKHYKQTNNKNYYNKNYNSNYNYGYNKYYNNNQGTIFERSKSDNVQTEEKTETNLDSKIAENNNKNFNLEKGIRKVSDSFLEKKDTNLVLESVNKEKVSSSNSLSSSLDITTKDNNNNNTFQVIKSISYKPLRPKAVISVFILNCQMDKVLLTKRFNEIDYGALTEKLEFGEDFDQCALRILNNSTNLSVDKERIKFICTYNVVNKETNLHLIAINYYLQILKEEEKTYLFVDPKHFETFGFFSFEELNSKLNLDITIVHFLKKFNILCLEDIKNLLSN